MAEVMRQERYSWGQIMRRIFRKIEVFGVTLVNKIT